MSIAVPLDRLRDEIAGLDRAPYLLTVSSEGRPHAVAVGVTVAQDALVLSAGRRTTANAARSPLVSLVWPPTEPDGYSLIVDGDASVVEESIRVTPTGAVFHRPGPAPEGSPATCGSDCVPLAPRPARRTGQPDPAVGPAGSRARRETRAARCQCRRSAALVERGTRRQRPAATAWDWSSAVVSAAGRGRPNR